VEAELLDAGGEILDRMDARLGLRTVELVTEPDSVGESFLFRVNGREIFARGANVIPLDHFTPRADSAAYRVLFDAAAHSNMNMLRVWGGGVYERDLFYDLADEYGILIWQDFMFANGLYPGDAEFLASVRAEARDQVRRLRNHPSVALWCGNNEIEEGWVNWGWQESLGYGPEETRAARAAYDALFHGVLPGVVEEMDPQRRYWPSSPSIGWGHPESLEQGDSHYWGVWWGREPFRVYAEKLPRFASEFGFQGYPHMATVEGFAEIGELGLDSPVMRAHQKHPTGVETIRLYLERELGPLLTDRLLARAGWMGGGEGGSAVTRAGLRDFILASQLLQARGMAVALEAHRMSPRTMGTLFWQLNDTWPVASWSSVDHFGRRKGLHYTARSAFAPLAVSLSKDGRIVRYASDSGQEQAARLEFAFATPEGGAPTGGGWDVTVRPGRGRVLGELPVTSAPAGTVVGVRLVAPDGTRLARATGVLGRWEDLPAHPGGSGVEVNPAGWHGDSLRVDVRGTRVAVGVHLEADQDGYWSDDFFDLLPGEERTLWFVPSSEPFDPGPDARSEPGFEVWTLNEALARLRPRPESDQGA
jgi:beta-mannosidase